MFDLTNCTLCPRMCRINRNKTVGYCGAGEKIEVAKIMHHHWEEPCISGDPNGKRASGTVFFAHCPLGCVYCQNGKISRRHSSGTEMTPDELAHEMLVLEDLGMYNVNFVSPTHYTPLLMEAVCCAKTKKLSRLSGVIMLLSYAAYFTYLVINLQNKKTLSGLFIYSMNCFLYSVGETPVAFLKALEKWNTSLKPD